MGVYDCTGVETEKTSKGMILGAPGGIWRVFLEILPLQKSKGKQRKLLTRFLAQVFDQGFW